MLQLNISFLDKFQREYDCHDARILISLSSLQIFKIKYTALAAFIYEIIQYTYITCDTYRLFIIPLHFSFPFLFWSFIDISFYFFPCPFFLSINLPSPRGRTVSKAFSFAEGENIAQHRCVIRYLSALDSLTCENAASKIRRMRWSPLAFRSISERGRLCETYMRHARLRTRGVCLVVTWWDLDVLCCVCISYIWLNSNFLLSLTHKRRKAAIRLCRA